MRFMKWGLIIAFVFGSVTSARADEAFFNMNRDLPRTFLDKFADGGFRVQEEGAYRLPLDFRLGPGDTLSLNLWGKLEASYEITLNQDGYLVVPLIGRIHLAGLTLNESRQALRAEIDKKYNGVEFDLEITDTKDIRVEVLGNIKAPGIYSVSPYSHIIEVLVRAGGPNENGTLSGIKLLRAGKGKAVFNFYDYILKEARNKNLYLKQDDVIFVPPILNIYALRGDVRYPGIYDQGPNPKLSRALEMAGGLLPTALERKISVIRLNPKNHETEVVKEIVLPPAQQVTPQNDFSLMNYDTVIVGTNLDYFPFIKKLYHDVSVSGEVEVPGRYLIQKGEALSSLLKRVKILEKTAFLKGAVFTRDSLKEKEKTVASRLIRAQEQALLGDEARLANAFLSDQEVARIQQGIEARRQALDLLKASVPAGRIIIDLGEIMRGRSDLLLENNDRLFIPAIPHWVLVTGEVYNPQSISFVADKPVEFYLNMVGGATNRGDPKGIYVIKPDGRTESKATGFGPVTRGDVIVVPEKSE